MGRPDRSASRRAALVDATIRVLAEDGLAAATVGAIARAAGLAPGLVHYYFPNGKPALFLATAESLALRLTDRIAGPSADAQISAMVALGHGADPAAVRAWVVLWAAAAHDPALADALAPVVRAARDRLAAALATEGVAAPEPAAAGLLAAGLGLLHLGTVAPDLVPAGSAEATLHAMAAGLR